MGQEEPQGGEGECTLKCACLSRPKPSLRLQDTSVRFFEKTVVSGLTMDTHNHR